jgi:hypothetical protein
MSGVFVTGSRPAWLMICRQRIRCHPQVSWSSQIWRLHVYGTS